MSNDYYLHIITKEFKKELEKTAKKHNTSLNDIYDEHWMEIGEIATWNNSSIFSDIVNELGVKTDDGIYVELSKEILEKAKEKLITILNKRFNDNVISKVKNYERVYTDWDYKSEVSKIIEMLNGVNQTLDLVDFNEDIILYRISC